MHRIASTELASTHGNPVVVQLSETDDGEFILTMFRIGDTKEPYLLKGSDREHMISRYLKTVRFATIFTDSGIL